MDNCQFTVFANEQIASCIWSMRLKGDTSAVTAPGQFVNLRIPGQFLRRPISVCDWTEGELRIVYKVVGEGTAALSRMQAGTRLDVLTGLGNGYDVEQAGNEPLLIGGGVGVPPLVGLAGKLRQAGKMVRVVLGFNTKADVILVDEFEKLNCEVCVVTMDGTYGRKGLVTDAIPGQYSCFYACGPMPMLRALSSKLTTEGQMSLEARMGCGFGVCVGCTIETSNGPRRVCKEGPVFKASEIKSLMQ